MPISRPSITDKRRAFREFAGFIRAEHARWGRLIKEAGMRLD